LKPEKKNICPQCGSKGKRWTTVDENWFFIVAVSAGRNGHGIETAPAPAADEMR